MLQSVNLQSAPVQSLGCPSWSSLQVLHHVSPMVPVVERLTKQTLPSRMLVGCTARLAWSLFFILFAGAAGAGQTGCALPHAPQCRARGCGHPAGGGEAGLAGRARGRQQLQQVGCSSGPVWWIPAPLTCTAWQSMHTSIKKDVLQPNALLSLQAHASEVHLKGICRAIWWVKWSTASLPGSCSSCCRHLHTMNADPAAHC